MQKIFNEKFIYDDGLLISNATGKVLCNLDRDGYIRVRLNGKEYRAHRVIWEMFNGDIPEGMLVDHIDHDVHNNRISNLRIATRQQNNFNSKAKSSNLPKGVTKNGGKYRAKISYNGETYSLGTYASSAEAEKEYIEAARILQGEFCYTP